MYYRWNIYSYELILNVSTQHIAKQNPHNRYPKNHIDYLDLTLRVPCDLSVNYFNSACILESVDILQ